MSIARKKRHLWKVIGLSATIGPVGAALATQDGPVAKASWWDRTTESVVSGPTHRTRSDLGAAASQQLAIAIDREWAGIDAWFGRLRPRSAGLQQALLFQTQEDLSETMRSHFAVDGSSDVFAFRSPLGQGIALSTEDTPVPMSQRGLSAALVCEYLRLTCGGDLPAALQCGLSDYFARASSFTAKAASPIGEAGLASVRKSIGAGTVVSIEELLRWTDGEFSARVARDTDGALREQCASVVRFLRGGQGSAQQAAFLRYLFLVSQGMRSGDAFASVYHAVAPADWAALDGKWREYALAERASPSEVVRERLAFLAEGFRKLDGQGARPTDFATLQRELTDRGFTAPASWRPGFSIVRADCSNSFLPVGACSEASPVQRGSSREAASKARFEFGPTEEHSGRGPTPPPDITVRDHPKHKERLTWLRTRPDAEAPWIWNIAE